MMRLFPFAAMAPKRESPVVQPPEILHDDEVTTPPMGEESARVAAEEMAFAANALPALIAYLDTSVRYVWVNEAYSRWFGRPREAILGRHPSELMGAAGWTAIQPHVERALAGEEVAFDNSVAFRGGIRCHPVASR
jgi:PAS domain-containing protein